MENPHQFAQDSFALASALPVPGAGVLPVNAYFIRGKEPALIDTQMPIERKGFLDALQRLIDPRDIRWIFITHDDRDHTGNIMQMLELAPHARVVTNFVSVGRMTEEWQLPLQRLFLINPGQHIDIGDRRIAVIRPPLFDSPSTLGLFDTKTATLFSADSFGAFIPSHASNAADMPLGALTEGMQVFNRVNHPWVSMVDQAKFDEALAIVQRLEPKVIASSHGPAAPGMTAHYLKTLAALPSMEPWTAPDQAALEAMMAATHP
jgi:flavorubredoxin